MLTWGLNTQATAERYRGRIAVAESISRRALEICRSIPDYPALTIAAGNLGLCHLRRGDLAEAVAVLEEANHVINERGTKGHEITLARNALAEAYLAEAEHARGAARVLALTKAKRACHTALRSGGLARGGLPGAMRHRGTYALLTGKHHAARRWWQRSLTVAKQLGAGDETAMTSFEMDRRLGERVRSSETRRFLPRSVPRSIWRQHRRGLARIGTRKTREGTFHRTTHFGGNPDHAGSVRYYYMRR